MMKKVMVMVVVRVTMVMMIVMVTTVKTVRAMVIRCMMQWRHSCKTTSRMMSPAISAKHFGSRLCRWTSLFFSANQPKL